MSTDDQRRLPKPGEVWTTGPANLTVVSAYRDAVTYTYNADSYQTLYARTLDEFLAMATPPVPTVMATQWILLTEEGFYVNACRSWAASHRIDRMSDDTFRVTEVGAP